MARNQAGAVRVHAPTPQGMVSGHEGLLPPGEPSLGERGLNFAHLEPVARNPAVKESQRMEPLDRIELRTVPECASQPGDVPIGQLEQSQRQAGGVRLLQKRAQCFPTEVELEDRIAGSDEVTVGQCHGGTVVASRLNGE